jgi:hypothetical protein
VAVQITHIRSNENRTQFERTRMLFDFVRAAFASPRTACTDLSRRLRDGVSFESDGGLIWNGDRPMREAQTYLTVRLREHDIGPDL